MWNRDGMGLKVAPQFREPSDGFCGLKLAGWETCISYYLSSSLGHILGTKKSAWLNRGHLLLLSWSQANVLIENHSLSPLSTPHSTFAHQLPNQEPLWPPHCQVQWIPLGSYHDPLSILSLLVTVWDHLISSFFWKHPLSIEEHHTLLNFPFLWTPLLTLFCWLMFFYSAYPGTSPSAAPGLCSSWTIPSMDLASNTLGITDSQTEEGLSKVTCQERGFFKLLTPLQEFWMHNLSLAFVLTVVLLGMAVPQLYVMCMYVEKLWFHADRSQFISYIRYV